MRLAAQAAAAADKQAQQTPASRAAPGAGGPPARLAGSPSSCISAWRGQGRALAGGRCRQAVCAMGLLPVEGDVGRCERSKTMLIGAARLLAWPATSVIEYLSLSPPRASLGTLITDLHRWGSAQPLHHHDSWPLADHLSPPWPLTASQFVPVNLQYAQNTSSTPQTLLVDLPQACRPPAAAATACTTQANNGGV